MLAKMESLGSHKHKNPETRTLEKNSQLMRPQKVGPWTPWGRVCERTFLIKSHNHPRNRPYRPPSLQNDRAGLKNNRPGLKNDRKVYHFANKKQDSCSQESKEIKAN